MGDLETVVLVGVILFLLFVFVQNYFFPQEPVNMTSFKYPNWTMTEFCLMSGKNLSVCREGFNATREACLMNPEFKEDYPNISVC